MKDLFKDLSRNRKVILRESEISREGVILGDEKLRRFTGQNDLLGCLTKNLPPKQHCYTFIQPMYAGEYNENQRRLAEGENSRIQIIPSNPILQLRIGLFQGYFNLVRFDEKTVTFRVTSDGYYSAATFLNDAIGAYSNYALLLQKVGFNLEVPER